MPEAILVLLAAALRLVRPCPRYRVCVNFFCVRWKAWSRFPLEIPRSCLAMPFRRDRSVTVFLINYQLFAVA